jgi:hypothetical protein
MNIQIKPPFAWREHLRVHPAADLFPLMPEAELKELAADIKANGLRAPITLWVPTEGGGKPVLLDGRNRLDALAQLGLLYGATGGGIALKTWTGTKWAEMSGDILRGQPADGDPYPVALSLNLNRRHLTPEQKRDLIAKLLKAKPEASNLAVAKQVKANDKTVAAVRHELEGRSEIPNVETRTDTKGRKQPARKKKILTYLLMRRRRAGHGIGAETEPLVTKSAVIEDNAEVSAEKRKAEYAAAPDALPPGTVSAKDTAQQEFDGHVLRLLQMTAGAKRWRFRKTSVPVAKLIQLGRFLIDTAGEIDDAQGCTPSLLRAAS